MSISPTGNSQQVQIKPDKNALPAISTDAANKESAVQPTTPVQPTGTTSQETESQTALISSQNTSEPPDKAPHLQSQTSDSYLNLTKIGKWFVQLSLDLQGASRYGFVHPEECAY